MNAAPKSREAQKSQTRQELLDAALRLVKDNRSFGSLSLREVTREVGIVPTAFYRHFGDMEELGLALVDSCFRTLRLLLREPRNTTNAHEQLIRRSVAILIGHIRAHPEQFEFIARERYGGVAAIRSAIRTEIRLFTSELATDLARLPGLNQWSTMDLHVLTSLLVNTMVSAAEMMLDLPSRNAAAEAEAIALIERQMRLVMLGAMQWRPNLTSTAPVANAA